MSEWSTEEQAAVQSQLGQQAQSAGGDPTAAGIYGDTAGASQHAPPQSQAQVAQGLIAQGGSATSVDAEALLAQLQALAAQVADLQAAKQAADVAAHVAQSRPPVLDEILGALSGVTPGIVHALSVVGERVDAIEAHLFPPAAPVE